MVKSNLSIALVHIFRILLVECESFLEKLNKQSLSAIFNETHRRVCVHLYRIKSTEKLRDYLNRIIF